MLIDTPFDAWLDVTLTANGELQALCWRLQKDTQNALASLALRNLFEAFWKTACPRDILLAYPLASQQQQQASAFRQAVWAALSLIPVGQTWTYAQVAQQIARPTAVRAVGQACKSNPWPLLVPCHRVVRATGAGGGYLGAACDMLALKQRLLCWEKQAAVYLSSSD